MLDLRGCSRLTGSALRSLHGCPSLKALDLRGTQLLGNVSSLLKSLSPLKNSADVCTPVDFRHVDSRLVVQAAWHGVVRSEDEWQMLVSAIGSPGTGGGPGGRSATQAILPPVDFKEQMLLVVSIAGLFTDNFWPKPLHRVKEVADVGDSLAAQVSMPHVENSGWMDMVAVAQSDKPVCWYFDQQVNRSNAI